MSSPATPRPWQMSRPAMRALAMAGTGLCALFVDTRVALGTAAGLLYLGVMLQAYPFRRAGAVLLVAILCSVMVVTGYLLSPSGGERWQALANRGMTLCSVWVVAFLLLRRRKERVQESAVRDRLHKHERELEETVSKLKEARTDQDRRSRALISITEDLREERKRLAEQIEQREQAEARFRATVESAPMAMVMADADGSIVLVNAEAEKLFGYDREHLLELSIEALMPGRFRDRHPELRSGFIREPAARRMGEGRELFAQHKDGTEFPVEIGLNPVQTDDGLHTLSAIIDISERKQAENLLQDVMDDLARSNSELEQFAYVASHDLQEPLRMVSSYLDLIVRRYEERLDEDGKEFIGFAVDGATRMRRMIQDLLQYSRVGTQAMSPGRVDMQEVLDRVMETLRLAIEESGATVHYQELPSVSGIQSHLEHLFQNLIGNAIKFRGPDPLTIVVKAERVRSEWIFTITDNGIGIDPRFADKIFQVFQRLHTREAYPGTGIGLALCKKIVERHGGRIWLESEPGQGAAFSFTLPALEPEQDDE